MKTLLIIWGMFHLGNGLYGLLSGQIGFFHKATNEFLPSIKWVYREKSAIFFWIVWLGNIAFGGFIIYFSNLNF